MQIDAREIRDPPPGLADRIGVWSDEDPQNV